MHRLVTTDSEWLVTVRRVGQSGAIEASDSLEILRIESRPSTEESIGAQDTVGTFEKLAELFVVLVCYEKELLGLCLDEEFDHGLV